VIAPELVDQIRDSADIVQIVGAYVKLRRSGGDFRGPCPFHGGKNPNFSVSARRNSYHCFKCGESGNVFTFLQKHLGMSFPDAVREVAGTVGIVVPDSAPERAGPDPREPFWEVNAAAAEFFRTTLRESPLAASARDYLAARSIELDAADRFVLGHAPADPALLRAHLATLGYDAQRLLEAGLLVQRENEGEPRARFRNRLMFPILDASSRHVGFGGRTLGDAEPKYLNSPETPVFTKGKTLYALNWCRNEIRRADRVFIVEGYFDAIRLMVAGVDTVVAPLGTALTPDQAALIARLTRNVFLLYDSDQAGMKATFRAGDELLRQGCAVRVITLPDGEDPDTFVRAHGASGLEAQLAGAVDVFERKIQLLERGGWFTELQRKRHALDRLLPTIRAASDPLLRELYVARAAEKAGVPREVLVREAGQDAARAAPAAPDVPRRANAAATTPHIRRGERRADHDVRGRSAERELIRAVLADPDRLDMVADRIGAERFQDPDLRAIFRAMLAAGGEYTIEGLAAVLDEDAVEVLDEIAGDEGAPGDPARAVADSIAVLAMRDIHARLGEIDREVTLATDEQKTTLIAEKQRLQEEIRLLGQSPNKSFKFTRRRPGARRE